MVQAPAGDISDKLIAYIRKSLGQEDIAYVQTPALLREGRRLKTFSFRLFGVPKEYAKPLILRLYSEKELPVRPHLEASVMNFVSDKHYPAPRVLFNESSTEYLGAPFLVMEEVDGEALFDIKTLLDKPYMATAQFAVSGIGTVSRELATAMNTLHALNTDTLIEKLKTFRFPVEHLSLNGRLYRIYKRIQNIKLTELEPGVIWLISHGPPEPVRPSLCHGQFYPTNVRKRNDTVKGIINWSMDSVLIGDPSYDIGQTSAAFKCFAPLVNPTMSRIGSRIGRRLSKQFVHTYRQLRSVSQEKINYFELLWCIDIATTAGESISSKSMTFRKEFEEAQVDLYRTAANAMDYFAKHTGVPVSLPLIRR